MIAVAATVLLASFAGSLHCAGMCGPLLALLRGGRAGNAVSIAYHVGRMTVYGALGVGAGTLGHGVEALATAKGLEKTAVLLTGVALSTLAVTAGQGKWHGLAAVRLRPLRAALATATPPIRGLLFGAATGLMPCGWLYAWVAVAGASGSAATGATIMLAFGAGAVPALLMSSLLIARAGGLARLRAQRLFPALLVASAIAVFVLRAGAAESVHRALSDDGDDDGPVICHG